MNTKIFSLTALLIVTLIFFNACKTERSIIKQPIKEEGQEYLFRKLKNKELKFKWLAAKFKIELIIDKNKASFKGQIRIRKDSLIWISLSPALGIEVARLMISEDSVKFINRINNTYFVGDYDYVNKFLKTSIDFDVLQSFIIGNDFQYYEVGKFRASIDNMEYKLSTGARQKIKNYVKEHEIPQIFIQNIWLNPDNFKITRINIKEINKHNKKLDAKYGEFEKIDDQLFPTYLNYEITSSNTKVYANVEFYKIVLDRTIRFPFSIPDKFTRVS